jgi:hypothetical protein
MPGRLFGAATATMFWNENEPHLKIYVSAFRFGYASWHGPRLTALIDISQLARLLGPYHIGYPGLGPFHEIDNRQPSRANYGGTV